MRELKFYEELLVAFAEIKQGVKEIEERAIEINELALEYFDRKPR